MNAFQNTTGPSLAATDLTLRRSASHDAAARRSTRKQTTTPRVAGRAVLRPIDYSLNVRAYSKA